jgi:hypothetical protein
MFIVCCKNRKKFDKYATINKVRNKYVIDVQKILEEEEIDADNYYFKILIMKRIQEAMEKRRDVYYIPRFDNVDLNVRILVGTMRKIAPEYTLNTLMFYDDFDDDMYQLKFIEALDEFEASQILKDY